MNWREYNRLEDWEKPMHELPLGSRNRSLFFSRLANGTTWRVLAENYRVSASTARRVFMKEFSEGCWNDCKTKCKQECRYSNRIRPYHFERCAYSHEYHGAFR